MKYKIRDKVRVIKMVKMWGTNDHHTYWADEMGNTIGKVFTIISQQTSVGNQLNTDIEGEDYWYPDEALILANPQLMLFVL